jgi:fermentation-respiration switch protein FrsA (DUF1100 family)
VFLILIVAAALAASTIIFYRMAVSRASRIPANITGMEGFSDTNFQKAVYETTQWMKENNCENWNMVSFDRLKLAAYFVPSLKPSAKTAILVNGYRSQGRWLGETAKFYFGLGFNVLVVDNRGSGESEGDYIGFGWHERKDILAWVGRVLERFGEESQIVLFGISMGGAAVMMASGEDLPKQVKAIIEDCGYTSAYDVLSYQIKSSFKLPPFPFVHLTSAFTKLKDGYSFFEASAVEQVKKSKVPILFIHGEDDRMVPSWMVYKVHEACASEKELYVVKNAGHAGASAVGGEEYDKKVTDFISRYVC